MASKPNTTPIYPGAVLTAVARLSVANTNRDGTGTITDLPLLAATDQGAVVGRVGGVHSGASGVASTAMVARLWRKNGGTYRLIDEVTIPSSTPSVTAVGSKFIFPRANIILAPGEALGVSISVAESVDVESEYTPY